MQKKTNFIKRAWLTVFLGMYLAGAPSPAQASALYFGESFIDWRSLEFSGIPVTWLNKSSASWNQAEDDFDFDTDSDSFSGWDNAFTEAISSVPHGQAHSSTDNDFLTQKLNAQVNGLDTDALVMGGADRFAEFIANEAGIFSVAVKYSLFQKLQTDEVGEFSFGDNGVNILINDSKDKTLTFGVADSLFNTVMDGDQLTLARSGMLKIDVPFNQGENGNLLIAARGNAFVYELAPQASAVPEPSTMALVGMGVASFYLRRRRLGV